jgi:predicted ArsR family transcriptional regulator
MTKAARQAWSAIEVLAEPTRRRVYHVVRLQRAPMTRDEVAVAVDIGRPSAAFHLDALVDAGLLAVDFARPPGRQGPGAGRPAKRYRRIQRDLDLSVPERRYDLAAQILLAGVRDAGPGDAREASFAAAADKGSAVAAEYIGLDGPQRDQACTVLADLGYEPVEHPEQIRLTNCPFHGLVEGSPELVCGINVHFVTALMAGLGLDDIDARFEPTPDECCVNLTATTCQGDTHE